MGLQMLICTQTLYRNSYDIARATMAELIIWNQSMETFQHILKTDISSNGVRSNEKNFAMYYADELINLFLRATLRKETLNRGRTTSWC